MPVPFALAPLAPVAAVYLRTLLGGLSAQATLDYIRSTPAPAPYALGSVAIPTSKAKSESVNNVNALSSAVSSFSTNLDNVSSSVSNSVSEAKEIVTNNYTEVKTINNNILSSLSNSPLLANQILSKDSIDNLVTAINNQTIASVSVLGTLDGHLSVLGGALSAISGTLLRISQNYDESLMNTEDLPYIDSETYYKMLSDSGLDASLISSMVLAENNIVSTMSKSGSSVADIKKAVLAYRAKTVPAENQLAVNASTSGVSDTKANKALTQSTVQIDGEVNIVNESLQNWANNRYSIDTAIGTDIYARDINARMVKNEYAINESAISDLDGNLLATVRPMEAHTIKSITEARLRTDMNNYRDDEDDIDFSMMDGLDLSELFTFDKKSVRLEDLKNALGVV